MAVRHLTDEQMQRYYEDGVFHDADLVLHLQQCPACRRQLQLYRSVYQGLRQDVGFELAPGFAESVVARLAAAPENYARTGLASLIVAVISAIVAAGLTLYFFGVNVLETLTGISAVTVSIGSSFVESLKVASMSLGVSTDIALFACLTLGTFGIIDRILLRLRGRYFCL